MKRDISDYEVYRQSSVNVVVKLIPVLLVPYGQFGDSLRTGIAGLLTSLRDDHPYR